MDLFVALIVISVIVTVCGWLFWIAVMFFIARAAMRGARAGLDQLMPELERMLGQLPNGGFQQLDPQRQQQLVGMLMQAQNQMAQMNNLSRQRYETRVGDLMGMAASAGIDWRP